MNKKFLFRFFACLLMSHVTLFSQAFADDKDAAAYFLALADIHFDPFIACENRTPCPLIQKLRAASANQWSKIFALYDVKLPKYRLDSNYQLLTSTLAASHKAGEKKNIQFVLALGDFLGHDFRRKYKKTSLDPSIAGYQSFVKKTMQFLTNELNAAFPATDVYALVGNNDSYHRDYSSKPNGSFFHDTASTWSNLIKNEANRSAILREFPTGGYYAVNAPNQPNLRIIMLNSVLFSTNSVGKDVDAAANRELEWLQKELASVKAKNQKAIIAMHIPSGIDVYATLRIRLFTLIELWQAKYTKRFLDELATYSSNIMAVFAAHLHTDWFQILTYKDYHYETPISGLPSVSPIFGNNPGFKIYSYSPRYLHLENYFAYYFPLKNRIWEVESNLRRVYSPGCYHCPILWGMNLLEQTNSLAKQYTFLYSVGTNSQSQSTDWVYNHCDIRDTDTLSYRQCT